MAIAYLNGEKIWVEGDVAYSVKDVESRYSIKSQEKATLEKELADLNAQSSDISAKINEKSEALNQVNAVLADTGAVLNRIKSASEPAVKVVEETPAEVASANVVESEPVCESGVDLSANKISSKRILL